MSGRTARSRRLTRRVAAIVAFAAVAIVAGLFAGGKVSELAFLAQLQHASGLRVTAGAVSHADGAYLLTDMTAATQDGAIFVAAPRARIALGSDAAIELENPRIVVAPLRLRAGDGAALQFGSQTCALRVHAGTLVVTGSQLPDPVATFEDLDGDARVGADDLHYDARMELVDGGQQYALQAHAAGGKAVWTAPLLPLAPLAALVPPDVPLQISGGALRDAEFDAGPSLRATARLEGVAATFDGRALRGLHGVLTLAGDGIGSRSLAGTLDGIPFSFGGEVHDLPAQWWASGSNDLAALGALVGKISNEPQLRWGKVEATAPGLTFGQYGIATDHGPLAISVLAIDPSERTLRFDTAIASDHVISGGERTSAMSVRTGAVAGVNGDYFDIGRTYEPQGMLVSHGELVRGPTDRAALVIDRNNRVTFGEFHIRGEFRTAHGSMPVTEFNDWPAGDVCVITPAFGKLLPTAPDRTFVALRPLGASGGTRFVVSEVAAMNTPLAPRFGVEIGPLVRVPLPKVGDVVSLKYTLEPHVAGVVAGIGGGPLLLRNGRWYDDPHAPAPDERDVRWPVIALSKTSNGRLMFVAVDGRHPERSVGMTRPEFGRLLLRLGGVDAMALDSGGSVTLVSRAPGDANASVRNVPSDFSAERWVSDALLLYSSAPAPTIVPVAHAPTPVPEARPTP